jgi:hypothetical protein
MQQGVLGYDAENFLHSYDSNHNISFSRMLAQTRVREPVELTDSESRISRNFEQMVSERIDDMFINEKSLYNDIYEKIKSKLFNLSDSDIIVQPEDSEYKKTIDELKKKVVIIYNHKIQSDIFYEDAKDKYTLFCNNITESIQCIDNIIGTDECTDSDVKFKEMLLLKIDEYYVKLNLEIFKQNKTNADTAFENIRSTVVALSGVLSPIICQICLDRQVEYFIDPCGHTICKVCMVTCKSSPNCHYCRHKKDSYKRLYL